MASSLTPPVYVNDIVGRRHSRSSLSLIAYLLLTVVQNECKNVVRPCQPVPSRCPRFVSAAVPPTKPTTTTTTKIHQASLESDIGRASGGGGQRVPCAPV